MRRRSPVNISSDQMEKGSNNKSQQSRVCVLGLLCVFFWGFLLYFHFIVIGGRSFQLSSLSYDSVTPVVRRPIDTSFPSPVVEPDTSTPKPDHKVEHSNYVSYKDQVFGDQLDNVVEPDTRTPKTDRKVEHSNYDSHKDQVFGDQLDNVVEPTRDQVDRTDVDRMEVDKKEVDTREEEVLPFMKAMRTVENKSDPCGGRYVYVHDLPSRFNEDMLKQCRSLSKWTNMCKFTTNAGLGPPLENTEGVFSDNGWYATNQFAVDVIFSNRMKQYECLTNDSSLAAAIFVPFYAGFDIARYLWGYNISMRDAASLDLVDWLQKRPEWWIMGGKDHFLVAGRITWDFRRLSEEETDWGNKLLFLPAAKNMSMLVVESSPWNANDFALPKPTMARTTRNSHTSIFLLCLTVSCVLDPTHFVSGQDGHQPIKSIVVLVLENRSFDHMIGWMKKSINPSINGVTGRECNPFSTNMTRKQDQESICFTDDAEYVDPDPGHSFEDVEKQVFGSNQIPSMTGFVEQALSLSPNLSNTVMKGFKPENVPVFAKLVQEFAVFDRWFSSIPGPTQPNRMFVYSATSHGSTSHVKKQLAKGYPQKTIFDSLYENGKTWGVYFQSIPTTLFYRNMRKLKYVFKFHEYTTFKQHAKDGKLPNLSVIEPKYFDIPGSPANDDHPSHDVANGQKLVKEVYETLRASPQWNQSLLVITYDEHGGFFDHVKTPYVNVPNPDGNTGPAPSFFKFDRLGVRVPTIMVSPWIKKGTVISSPKGPTSNSEYEHSSIPATIKKMFNLSSNFLTHRDAWAGTFEQVVGQLSSPRTDCPEVLPQAAPLRATEPDESRGLSQFQSEVVQLAAVLNGDHFLSSFPDEMGKKMNVKEANTYVKGAVSRFITASKEAIKLGADKSAIVDMRSSLTTRTVVHN